MSPPFVADERTMLDAWLDFQRATLLAKCEGLDDAQLRTRSVPPASLSLLGLVRHMSEVERSWFRRTLAGENAPPMYYSPDNEDGDFDDLDQADVVAADGGHQCGYSRDRNSASTPGHVRSSRSARSAWPGV